MLTVEQIKNNISNYRIENGIVVDKSNNQLVQDEDKILEIKSSVMMYREAKLLFDKRLRGAPEDKETYINKALKVYGLNGEVNDYPQNKIIREILQGDGSIQVDFGGNSLSDSEKFSFLCEPKKEYGLATIKYMAHQQGIDISNLDVSIDLSEFQKIGVSKVNIRYSKSQYQRKEQSVNTIEVPKVESKIQPTQSVQQPLYQHPMANELNELERQKQIAKQNNDEDAYKYAQSNIERIINQNQASISPEKWDSLSIDEQISFAEVKINESKILHDKDAFDNWNVYLNELKAKKSQDSQVDNKPIEKLKEIVEQKEPEQNYKYYYEKLMNAVKKRQTMMNATEEEKKQITGEIFYNEGYLIEKLSNEEEMREIMTSVVNDLSENELDVKLQNIIIEDMQERLKKLNNKSQTGPVDNIPIEESIEDKSSSLDFSTMINQLRVQTSQISSEYRLMLSDGYIDDDELALLIGRLKDLADNASVVKSMVTDKSQEATIDSIVEMINQESIKMTSMQAGIEETNHSFGK